MRKKSLLIGQTIVEVLIAVGIVTVALIAVVQVSTRSVTNSGISKRQSLATSISSKIVEALRVRKNELTWAAFKSQLGGGRCFDFSVPYPTPAIKAAGSCSEYQGFTNTIQVTYATPAPSGPEIMDAAVTVTWNENGQIKDSKQSLQLVKY